MCVCVCVRYVECVFKYINRTQTLYVFSVCVCVRLVCVYA